MSLFVKKTDVCFLRFLLSNTQYTNILSWKQTQLAMIRLLWYVVYRPAKKDPFPSPQTDPPLSHFFALKKVTVLIQTQVCYWFGLALAWAKLWLDVMLKDFRNAPFYIHCLFHEADLRMFPVLVYVELVKNLNPCEFLTILVIYIK